MEIKNYFEDMEKKVTDAYSLANTAKKKGFDPDDKVDIPLAKNIFERVEGLIGALKPEIIGSGVSQRLKELDTKYGSGDWRVALKIAEETADGVFCSFVDNREAIEVGTRVGLAYITMGVVSAPLEGFIEFKIKDRLDGKKYGSFYFAGPIRAAGGTAAAVTLIIGDYLRRKFGLEPFDITQDEITRTKLECETYHNMVARLQYNPKPQEFEFLLKKVPIEINGDPTSEREVLILKDLPRVGTPRIRGGMCLVLCEGLAQKAKKILKNIEKWGKEFGLEEWLFLKEYIDLQKKLNATAEGSDKKEESTHKIKPNFIYIDETVAGRPIFSYPLTKGGFRLRYGRSRLSGLAAAGINPATMTILGDFIASGSQLRIERPGKACIATPCTSIDGPIIKLNSGQVIQVNTEEDALKYKNQIKEILSIGDILINYGEFVRNNHILVPSPYVEEQWVQELAKAAGSEFKIPETLDDHQIIEYSNKYNIPLHPTLLNFYNDVDVQSLVTLAKALSKSTISKDNNNYKIILPNEDAVKRILELICMQHKSDLDYIIIEGPQALGLLWAFGYLPEEKFKTEQIEKLASENKTQLELLNSVSKIKLMDKSGTYIGARLGRPEKAKQRKLKGTPHVLFPIGTQGGRLRSVNEALEKGFVEADIPVFECPNCQLRGIYPRCEKCMLPNKAIKFCARCGKETDKTHHCGTETRPYTRKNIDVRFYLNNALQKLNTTMPVLVKGVRGLSSANRIPEPIEKGILRALHDVYVNKDGTIRFDAIEAPVTHFKPREIGTSIEQLKQLGYTHDIEGIPLENDNQMLELYPQDVILPDCKEWKDSSALDTIVRTCAFIDDLLTNYYGTGPYYNVKSMSDVVGNLIIAIAPHTSAGIIGRIIGFSKTQAFYAHPYFHSACRRNCVHPSTNIIIYDEKENRVLAKPIGEIVETLIAHGVKTKKDSEFTLIKSPDDWRVFSVDPETHKIKQNKIRCFIKGQTPKKWIKIRTVLGREFKMTPDHTFLYMDEDGFASKCADSIRIGDKIPLDFRFNPPELKTNKLNLLSEFLKLGSLLLNKEMKITGASDYFKQIVKRHGQQKIRKIINFSKQYQRTLSNWYKNVPLTHLEILIRNKICDISSLPKTAKLTLWQTSLPIELELSNEFMRLIGYYTAEGHAHENKWTHQISFRICKKEVFNDLVNCIKNTFGFIPNIAEKNTKANISNKIIYYLFTEILKVGKNAHTKRVPSILFNLNKEKISNFISAYFDGDGSALPNPLRVQFYSTSQDLLNDIGIILSRFGILARYSVVPPRLPGRKIIERYKELGKEPRLFGLKHLTLGKYDAILFSKVCNPVNMIKKEKLKQISRLNTNEQRYTKFEEQMVALKAYCDFTLDIVKDVEEVKDNVNSYCLDIFSDDNIVSKNVLWGNQLFQIRCDGDELAFMMLMDALLNFSRQYLPNKRGSRYMDLPLVLTTRIDPNEIDDEVYNMDIVDLYPLEFYAATREYKSPYEVKIKQVASILGTPGQYRNLLYTHPTESINAGNKVSSYKTLLAIMDKVQKQMDLTGKLRAVDKSDVARILIEKHFLKDIKGNLRRYSSQEFRCLSCNTKYRRIPLVGHCNKCSGKLVLTVAEGTVSKYLEPSLDLAEKYNLPNYLKQTLDILKRKIESVFGKEATKQTGLGSFVNS